jgi:diguanylate cyclase
VKRYQQTRAQSAELFRLALQRMSEHTAAFNPQTYAVWYEHLAGMNSRLSQALEQRLKAEPQLADDAIAALHQAHVADIDAATAERVSVDMRRVMDGLRRTAETAGGTASDMGGKLEGLSRALQGLDSGAIATQVQDALASTTQMRVSVDALRAQVDNSQAEIERLRGELDRAREEAVLCPLTGVLNRKGFDDRLRTLFDAARKPGGSLCLAMFDLDHFKQINDVHGHLIGDRVLEATGLVLRRAIADAGPAVSAARYGGEEFAVLLPGCDVDAARDLAEQVRAGVKTMRIRQRQTDRTIQTITVSAGVTSVRPGDDPASFVARADAALYQSKHSGRDRVTVA